MHPLPTVNGQEYPRHRKHKHTDKTACRKDIPSLDPVYEDSFFPPSTTSFSKLHCDLPSHWLLFLNLSLSILRLIHHNNRAKFVCYPPIDSCLLGSTSRGLSCPGGGTSIAEVRSPWCMVLMVWSAPWNMTDAWNMTDGKHLHRGLVFRFELDRQKTPGFGQEEETSRSPSSHDKREMLVSFITTTV
jgi:hypothetical protein